ncbi:MAG: SEL1-like repeat protein [Pseudomonadales bacterium]|nr:SEL1-like repeat protein [Pseudomonadales bacterium]
MHHPWKNKSSTTFGVLFIVSILVFSILSPRISILAIAHGAENTSQPVITKVVADPPPTTDFEQAIQLYQQNNYKAAFSAFHKLSTEGNIQATAILALMHKFGEGTQKNASKAFELYLRAAKAGDPLAQFHTGIMFAQGQGVEQNLQQGFSWLRKAEQQGFDRATDKLQALGATNTDVGFYQPPAQEDKSTKLRIWNFRLPNSVRYPAKTPSSAPLIQPYQVQVGAMESRKAAINLWQVLTEKHAPLFRQLSPRIKFSQDPGKQVYRIHTGRFATLQSAKDFCKKLLAKPNQAGCLPMNSTSPSPTVNAIH